MSQFQNSQDLLMLLLVKKANEGKSVSIRYFLHVYKPAIFGGENSQRSNLIAHSAIEKIPNCM